MSQEINNSTSEPLGKVEFFDFEGMKIAFVRGGSGSPLLFLHNGGTSHSIWVPLMRELTAKHQVAALDLLGYGKSSKPGSRSASGEAHYSMEQYLKLLERFIQVLGVERPVLVGNCMGSAISLHYTHAQPASVSGLVLFNPLTERTLRHGALGSLVHFKKRLPGLSSQAFKGLSKLQLPAWSAASSLAFQLGKLGRQSGLTQHAELRSCHSSPRQLESMLAVLEDIASYAAVDQLSLPMDSPPLMTIWGGQNKILSVQQGRQLNRRLGGQRHHELSDCGHLAMLEAPGACASLIEEFLADFINSKK